MLKQDLSTSLLFLSWSQFSVQNLPGISLPIPLLLHHYLLWGASAKVEKEFGSPTSGICRISHLWAPFLSDLFSSQKYQVRFSCLSAIIFVCLAYLIRAPLTSRSALWGKHTYVCVRVRVHICTLPYERAVEGEVELAEIAESQSVLLFPSSWCIDMKVIKLKCWAVVNTCWDGIVLEGWLGTTPSVPQPHLDLI